ncbi:MAG TPA: PPK2 family polyphosphate kinase [Acidimicrobiales bacterium]|nr:PPK2 family polyphosphate kinase [Acidimicrobiales bacterium]
MADHIRYLETTRFRVAPGAKVRLNKRDPATTPGMDKQEGKAAAALLNTDLEALQELLYADGRHKLLVILQGVDACGKDGTIRSVFDGVNPQGVKVASFKRPTEEELGHDYLWRVHSRLPRSGEIAIFNRSHYEDVLVVRVRDLVPRDRWSKRYEHIRAFEQMLVDEGTTIVKFFLHISKEEQRVRLQERIDDPAKRWKFSRDDLGERKLWDEYRAAFEDMLTRTSTADSPWYVIPADSNWYRNLVVSQVLVDTMRKLELRHPPTEEDLAGLVVE